MEPLICSTRTKKGRSDYLQASKQSPATLLPGCLSASSIHEKRINGEIGGKCLGTVLNFGLTSDNRNTVIVA